MLQPSGVPKVHPNSAAILPTGYDQPPSIVLFVLYACLRLLIDPVPACSTECALGACPRTRMAPPILEQLLMPVGLACQPRHALLGRGSRRRKQIPTAARVVSRSVPTRDERQGGENVLSPV